MDKCIREIRDKAQELLETGQVEVVIGFTAGTLPGKSTPCFITRGEDCKLLVWDEGCKNNLANYLLKEKRKAAIIIKGCDSRSLVNLLTENQLSRDRVVILGAPCPLTEGCEGCQIKSPVIYDYLVSGKAGKTGEDDFHDVKTFARLSPQERKEYFYKEVSKCIRCYACRNACPACYCRECFVENNLPQWVGKSTQLADNLIFHLTRALHVAGRCVDCGACQRACPMGVDLRILNRKMLLEVKELYQFEAGLKEEQELPLNTYDPGDPEPFLAGGGEA
ncbi:MAG: coenzyme F420-reducing hydrogenase, beta subunit [Peptococcaceae bacterium]|jgi:ferredoxin|nr:coenzyme F420-reducing hydrogenase, beta subunit [Peptococcaceae bacterium]